MYYITANVFSGTSECFLDATLCEQVCTDTDRGFVCSCMEGYQLLDGNQCEGKNTEKKVIMPRVRMRGIR